MAERNVQPVGPFGSSNSRQSWSVVLNHLARAERLLGDVYADKGTGLEYRVGLKAGMANIRKRMNQIRTYLGEYDYACSTSSPVGWDF